MFVIGFDQAMVYYFENRSASFDYVEQVRKTLTGWNEIMIKLGFDVFVTKQINLTTTDLSLSQDRNNSTGGYLENLTETNVKHVVPVYRQ